MQNSGQQQGRGTSPVTFDFNLPGPHAAPGLQAREDGSMMQSYPVPSVTGKANVIDSNRHLLIPAAQPENNDVEMEDAGLFATEENEDIDDAEYGDLMNAEEHDNNNAEGSGL